MENTMEKFITFIIISNKKEALQLWDVTFRSIQKSYNIN
ncbi:hypothetical protein ADIARSV_1388 [Arcticibacter svalbardensis MN12-7]|uniref:Uncharacterized protein n=1 Tax=Arcticibacter svalbardensis MN12-7 TaxID=1150600 RepID=R9GU48_9SPHI|nr:hypothetical protein ADIARSV_1388 [Arcticibacter svalbardensis MN12-7]